MKVNLLDIVFNFAYRNLFDFLNPWFSKTLGITKFVNIYEGR